MYKPAIMVKTTLFETFAAKSKTLTKIVGGYIEKKKDCKIFDVCENHSGLHYGNLYHSESRGI